MLLKSALPCSFISFLAASLFRSPNNEHNIVMKLKMRVSVTVGRWARPSPLNTPRVSALQHLLHRTQWRENKWALCPGRRASRIHFHNVKNKKKSALASKHFEGQTSGLTFPSRLSENTTGPPRDGRYTSACSPSAVCFFSPSVCTN